MERVNSFDVFDTLIARRFITNDHILRVLQNISNNPDFYEKRKQADNGSRSLLQIYEELAQNGTITHGDIHKYYKSEVELEKKHCFPIQANIDLVKEGDILISDMYMSAADILELVRGAGLDVEVTIYQSNSDKRSGVVWDKVKDVIDTHTGDNAVSDIENANSRNIKTQGYYDAIQFTGIEKVLYDSNLNLMSMLIREVRIKTSSKSKDPFNDIATQLNLPWLLFACEMLHRKLADKNIVFLGRDCYNLYKVYSEFYQTSYYIPFSRKVAFAQPNESVEYLKKHIPPNSVLVDISSTGATWENICKIYSFDVCVLIFSDLFFYTSKKPNLPKTFSWLTQNSTLGQTNELIEIFNSAKHGPLIKIINHNGVYFSEFGMPELSSDLYDKTFIPINEAIKTAKNYVEGLRKQLNVLSDEELYHTFKQFTTQFCNQTGLLKGMQEYLINQNNYMQQVKESKKL